MPFLTTSCFHNWKAAKQKEQLNKAIIKAGFCPSHFLMDKLTILREKQDGCLREEFYLSHHAADKKLLLRSIAFESDQALTLECEGCNVETLVFDGI